MALNTACKIIKMADYGGNKAAVLFAYTFNRQLYSRGYFHFKDLNKYYEIFAFVGVGSV